MVRPRANLNQWEETGGADPEVKAEEEFVLSDETKTIHAKRNYEALDE